MDVMARDGNEIEYQLLPTIATAWLFKLRDGDEIKQVRKFTIDIEFRHEPKNVSLSNWEFRCAAADFATFGYSWDPVGACRTEPVNETTTKCCCSRTGTFALILTTQTPKVKSDDNEFRKIIVIAGCSISLLLTTISGAAVIYHWFQKKSCILFIKCQCCVSLSGAISVFIAAHLTSKDEALIMYIRILLETFFLIALSTQLSKLLVVYTEMVQLPKSNSTKQTIIGIITGVPLITVFGSHLAHRTMDIRIESWWIVPGSLSFYVFMTCFVIIIVLYFFVYFIVDGKINKYIKVQQKNLGCFQQRILLIQKSAYIFISIVGTIASSVAYINYIEEEYWNYEFSAIIVILGAVMVTCYVLKPEAILYPDILDKIKIAKKEDMLFTTFSNNINFYNKEEAETESESTPQTKYVSKSTSDLFKGLPYDDQPNSDYMTDLTKYISCDITNTQPPEVVPQDMLEKYNSSPKQFRKKLSIGDNKSSNPATVCLDLDLVVSFNTEENKHVNLLNPTITITSDENSLSGQTNKPEFTTFRISESKNTKVDETNPTTSIKDDLDGVLTSISEDLDYLLNQNDPIDVDSLKRKKSSSKSPKSHRHKLVEGETKKVPEALTDILRTHC